MFGVPNHNVSKSLLLVMDIFVADGYDIIYYNAASFQPREDVAYRFVPYPVIPGGYDAGRIGADITYFQFGELLMDTAAGIMDFLLEEVQRERPDFIFHSHLAVWGKLIARYFDLPAVNFNTVIVLDRRVMLPYFRKIREAKESGVDNVIDAVGLLRKGRALYTRLGFSNVPDLWDVYVNRSDLNICLFPDFLQPERALLEKNYVFTGCPFDHRPGGEKKTLVYMAMGTVLNEDIPLYRRCIGILEEMDLPGLLSVGSKIAIGELQPKKDFVKVVAFTDQPEVLKRSILFITRGGMASLLEAIQTLTPMIVIPIIPEQRLNAERVAALGIGVYLPGPEVDDEALRGAIYEVLDNREAYRQRLSRLVKDMDPMAARRRLLQVVNDHVQPQTVVHLFLRQAKATPNLIALCSGDSELTYGSLDKRSSRLAFRLAAAGVERGRAVPVLMEHGIGVVIAMLGIMRLGAVYVPVDADYPEERLAYLLKDTGCQVVVSDRGCCGKLPTGMPVIDLEEEEGVEGAGGRKVSPSLPGSQDAAYIMYTSGSTGRPKGVVVEHRQLYRYLLDVSVSLELRDCRSYAMLGTFAADAGLTAVFGALCFGARLDLIQIKKITSREALQTHFRRHPVDCYKITPSLLDVLLQDADMEVILPRKRLVLGGESCPWQLVSRVHGMLQKGCVLYNHYGPTETTVGVLTYRFPDDKAEFPAVIPLGQPLAHVQIYLLDAEMQEVEQGATAELYIGGDLVAREYLNKPELTAEHFLQYRHKEGPVRVYRTGDLVRQLPDGNIEYLGRMDDQVKINGYRIELKEIEQAILSAGKVRNCVVLARDNAAGWKRLVGYILPGEGYEKEALISFLRNRLPAYMIPACWVELAEWPLTLNNKTDRQGLPCPKPKDEITVEEDGGTRKVLSAIWSRLLECEVVDTTAEFIALGGDSLLLIELAYEIKREFHISIPSALLYRSLTIDALAAWLDAKKGAVVREEPSAPKGFDPLQASSAERNFYLKKQLYPDESFPNSSLSFQVMGSVDIERLEKALATVIGMHESLRTSYFLEQRKVIRRVWEKADLSLVNEQAGGEDIDEVINRITQPFDFDRPPLMRVFLIRLKEGGLYFHLDMPHIVSDGKSLEVIMEDLAEQYNSNCPGGHRLGFTDFQQYFHAYQHSRQYLEDAAFWKESLGQKDVLLGLGSGSTVRLPRFAGSGVTVVLPVDLAKQLNKVAMELGITRFQFFLTVYYLLLYKITAQSGLTVMVPFNNRYENGSEKMVGLLVNVMPVRLDIRADWTIAELFAHCKQRLLDAAIHQQFPFEKILEMRTLAGGDAKSMMQTFFGWHGGTSVYQFGEATFRLHVPVRNKESLPLSVGVFDTDPTPTIRFSALLAAYDAVALKAMAERYVRLLELILVNGVDRMLTCITNEAESII